MERMDAAASSTIPTLYWRPGCGYCMRLRRKLHKAGVELNEINIWQDLAGAAEVRDITGGDETVPTLVVAGEAMVNPSPRRALQAIKQAIKQAEG